GAEKPELAPAVVKCIKIRHWIYPAVIHYNPYKRAHLLAALYELHALFRSAIDIVVVNVKRPFKQVMGKKRREIAFGLRAADVGLVEDMGLFSTATHSRDEDVIDNIHLAPVSLHPRLIM